MLQCFSRFGEVVFTLTRFFRDGGTRGPTKLSLLEAEDGGQCPLLLHSFGFHCVDLWSLPRFFTVILKCYDDGGIFYYNLR